MHSLVLYCHAPLWRSATTQPVVRVLEETGLIGLVKGGGGMLYGAGEHFLARIMFLGCSPQISLNDEAASNGQPVCRIRLHHYENVQLLESHPAPALRCLSCRTPFQRPSSLKYDQLQTCVKCGESALLHQIDWRRGAAFGRFFVEIENVFPHEAVPADRLMSVLEALSDERWDYFYFSR